MLLPHYKTMFEFVKSRLEKRAGRTGSPITTASCQKSVRILINNTGDTVLKVLKIETSEGVHVGDKRWEYMYVQIRVF